MLTKYKVKNSIDRIPKQFTVDQIVDQLMILEKIEDGLKDSAHYLGDFAIRLQFNDGIDQLVDFKPFLIK